MRIIFFIILACITFVPSAFAGSLSKPPVEKISRQNWKGFYTGLLLGGQFGRSSDKTNDFGYNADNNKWTYGESGFNGGVEFGYSYAWNWLVLGPEIELGYLGMHGSRAQPDSPASDTIGKSDNNFYTMLRAQIGADLDHYLLFVTGGAIGSNYSTEVVDNCNIAPCGGSTVNAKKNNFVWGYTVGVGAGYLFAKNWALKFDSLYFNLSNQSFSGTTDLGETYQWTGKTFGFIIRGGFDYYF